MEIIACGASHKGNIRGHNEDNIYVDGTFRNDLSMDNVLIRSRRTTGPHTYAVFDGLGGEACGEQASLLAALGLKVMDDRGAAGDIDTYISAAHHAILEESIRKDAHNMGTTVAAVVIDSDTANVFNVGDSRVYLYRDGELIQMSKDHSVAQSLIDSGLMKEADRKNSAYSSELTQYIGMNSEEEVEPSAYKATIRLNSGDILILCSDGLTNELSNGDILSLIERYRHDTPETMVGRLLSKAVAGKCIDNVSAVVVYVV